MEVFLRNSVKLMIARLVEVAGDGAVVVAEEEEEEEEEDKGGISYPTIASEHICINCISSLYEVED